MDIDIQVRVIRKWLVISIIVLTLTRVQVTASGIFIVKPTNETSCPKQPCHTLEHYAQSWQKYLTSNTIIEFLPGEHILNGEWGKLYISNASNLTLIGHANMTSVTSPSGIPKTTSRIICRRGRSFFVFLDVTELSIIKLTFSNCGGELIPSTLFIYRVSNLVFDSVTVQNGTGSGLMGYNILGNSSISRSAFYFNAASVDTPGGNVQLLYQSKNCLKASETSTLTIKSSLILSGDATRNNTLNKSDVAGGLTLSLNQSCYSMKVHIRNTTVKENVGGKASMILLRSSAYNSITISESHFEGGYATNGGGISIGLISEYNASQCTDRNQVYITNTVFVGNLAVKHGGALLLVSSHNPCTEVFINACNFNDNTALENGGHIVLKLNSSSLMNSLNITINNCKFENGRAGGGGGGVSVWPASSEDTSCLAASNANDAPLRISSVYIRISNSKFHQNIATYGGGIAIQFDQSCFATHVTIYNVSLSRNSANATRGVGGNLYIMQGRIATGSSVTVNRSIVENGSASEAGGGVAIGIRTVQTNIPSSGSQYPITINVINSTIQHNTAGMHGGGLAISFEQLCCRASVDIADTLFLNNGGDILGGGNIWIMQHSYWLQSTVRIENSLIKGGIAEIGGGICLIQGVYFWQKNTDTFTSEALYISSTKFIYNRATTNDGGASIMAAVKYSVHLPLYSTTPTITQKIAVKNVTFNGACASSNNIKIVGGRYVVNPSVIYSVLFTNVSFKDHSTACSYSHSRYSLHSPPDLPFSDNNLQNIQPGMVMQYVSNVTFINCSFIDNVEDGAIIAVGTNMIFEGNITFRGNRATQGGGIRLDGSSFMYLRPNTHIMFSNNYAAYVGGGIYVNPDVRRSAMCFFQIDQLNTSNQSNFVPANMNIRIEFNNNTAESAGSALYGGNVDFCISFRNIGGQNFFGSVFQIQNTNDIPSAVSSDPYSVCFCTGMKVQCQEQSRVKLVYTYPGALFHIPAVVVGQKDGTVPGVIHAILFNTSALLGDLQESQSSGKRCTTLNYTVFSPHPLEIIILSPEDIQASPIASSGVRVLLLPCPLGFMLTGFPPKCNCAEELQNHHIYNCDITNQTITRPSPLWIGYYHLGNSSTHPVEGILVHDDCPFDYCKPDELLMNLNASDIQCAFNRSGILCGACQTGFSLALGTSRCLECSNKYIPLLLVFAVAGLALVLLLTLTNMTISEGTINGLIFHVNIIHINQAIFLPAQGHGILLHILSVFIAWMNLDLGIETCFYNGMDMYAKAWLQFIFPIYIWSIVGGMIISSHYSTTAAKLFRRHAVKVLATLFLMSFAKLQRTIIMVLSFTFLTYPDGTRKAVWLYDSNIEYLKGKHIPLFLAGLFALLFLLIPYTLVILFIQCLQSKSSYRMLIWVEKLKPLLDAYAGPYKDRYRFWTGFLLLIRTILFLVFIFGNPGLNLIAIILVNTCLALVPGVYKKVLLSILDYTLLLNLSAISTITLYSRYDTQLNQVVIVYISVGITLLTFVSILIYHLYQCTTTSKAWKTISGRLSRRHPSLNEEAPPQAEIRPLVLQFSDYREPVLAFDD